jgi:hypothetical protein
MTSPISSATAPNFQINRNDDRKDRLDKAMQGVAELLDMTTEELRDAQRNGTTLADLAEQKGVSVDDLKAKLAEGLEANAPADAPAGIDFTQMASQIIDGKGPGGRPGGMMPPQSTGENTASALQSLLESTGIDPDQLEDLLLSTLNGTSSSDEASTDFATQLKNLISQYGSKGVTYDSKL